MSIRDRLDQWLFDAIYSRTLVYNACWEDPAIDRQALVTGRRHLLASRAPAATCSTMRLLGPNVSCCRRESAPDRAARTQDRRYPRARLRRLLRNFRHGPPRAISERIYRLGCASSSRVRTSLWDKHWDWFAGKHGSFYFHGLSGLVARGVRALFPPAPRPRRGNQRVARREVVARTARDLRRRVAPLLWNRMVNWIISRQFVMSLLGVPYPQRKLVEAQHARGISSSSARRRIRVPPAAARRQLFLSLYLTGHYVATAVRNT